MVHDGGRRLTPRHRRFGLEEDEIRQLKTFLWCLLIINFLLVGIGVLIAKALGESGQAPWLILAAAVFVNVALVLVVGGDVLATLLLRGRRRGGGS